LIGHDDLGSGPSDLTVNDDLTDNNGLTDHSDFIIPDDLPGHEDRDDSDFSSDDGEDVS